MTLSSSSPGDRDHDVRRPLDPGALEHEELGRVALVHLVLELRLEVVEARRRAARSASPRGPRGSASARGSSRPCRRLRSGRYIASAALALGRAHDASVRTCDRARRRADDVEAARACRTPRAPGRGCGRRRSATPNCFCAIWPITMFVLSPSVATTTASASSIPASRRSGRSMPWPTRNSPAQSSPSRPSASSRSSIDETSQPARRSSSATAEPTRPQPTTITFTRSA